MSFFYNLQNSRCFINWQGGDQQWKEKQGESYQFETNWELNVIIKEDLKLHVRVILNI
jgi:hypothetical protein